MKKFVAGLIIGILLMSTFVYANEAIQAKFFDFNFEINGQSVEVKTKPIVVDGTSYLPVREIATLLGYNVDYKEDSNTIKLTNSNLNNHSELPNVKAYEPPTYGSGEDFSIGDITFKLIDVEYSKSFESLVADSNEIFAIVSFEVHTPIEPKDRFYWYSIDFVRSVNAGNKTLVGVSASGESSKIYPNKTTVAKIFKAIPIGEKLSNVLFYNPSSTETANVIIN